jgi:hypothetical protein
MRERLDGLPPEKARLREFLGTYQRTTLAIGDAVDAGEFEDPEWVERWDVAFAELYVDALDAHLGGGGPSRPWRLAFDAPPELPALRHVLLGINAHVNYDLPQALLAVISDDDFTDASLMASRRRDHERIDARGARPVADRPRAPATEPVGVQAVPAGVTDEGLAQHRRTPPGARRRHGRVRRAAG